MQLAGQNFIFEDEAMTESTGEPEMILQEAMPSMDAVPEQYEPYPEQGNHKNRDAGWWSKEYKQARKYLYGDDSTPQDFVKAFHMFRQEAEKGNGFAMHDLGRMCADGLGCEINPELSQEWYAKALSAFHAAEQSVQPKQRPYLWYRIGKCMQRGLSTEQNYETAAEWFSQAVAADHKYAQYSLGGLYYRGQGVEQSYEQAFHLYCRSAEQGNPYADYETAKMYRDGIGTTVQPKQAEQSFQSAFWFYPLWKSKVMTINCSTVWDKCCIREPERKKMRKLRQSIGKRPQSSEMSMLSMLWQSCGWKQTTEMYPKHCNG